MIQVNTHEAKSRLSALLEKVEKEHEHVRICRNGRPVAMLVSLDEVAIDPFIQHDELRGIIFNENPDEPLTEDEWPGELR